MNMLEDEDGGIVIADIDPFFAMMIRELPGIACSDDENTRARIYPSPTGGSDEDADSDWKSSVEPELRELFSNAIDLVVENLAVMKETEETGLTLRIPTGHVDAWMHTLNRARLSLAAQWDIDEDDMELGPPSRDSDPERTMALLRIEIYGVLLEFLVRTRWKR